MKILLLYYCLAIAQSVSSSEAPSSESEKGILGNSNTGSFVVPFQRLSRRDALGAVLPLAAATSSLTDATSTLVLPSTPSSLPVPKQVYGLATENSGDGLSILARLQRVQNYGPAIGRKYNHYIKDRLGITLSTSLKKRSNTSLQMGDGPSDYYYFGSIVVGTPPVSFLAQLDTGSADFILMSDPCYSGCDDNSQLYRASDSSTSVVSNTKFSIQYGSGNADGVLATDVVQVGNFSYPQVFGALQNSNGIYHGESGVTGLLGLAWQSIAQSGAMPFVQGLYQNGHLDAPLFAMAFSRWETGNVAPGGIMTIGAVNSSLYTGTISYTNSAYNAYWEIPLDDVSQGGVSIGQSSTSVLIDTGTSLIYIPQKSAAIFYAKIPGSSEVGGGIYQYFCNATINLGFKFSGVTWIVSDIDFNLGYASQDLEYCYGGLGYFQGANIWILGDVFLKNVYSVFRFSPSSIGFANLANPSLLLKGFVPVGNGTTVHNGANNTSIVSKSTTSMTPISTTTTAFSTSTPLPTPSSSTSTTSATSISPSSSIIMTTSTTSIATTSATLTTSSTSSSSVTSSSVIATSSSTSTSTSTSSTILPTSTISTSTSTTTSSTASSTILTTTSSSPTSILTTPSSTTTSTTSTTAVLTTPSSSAISSSAISTSTSSTSSINLTSTTSNNANGAVTTGSSLVSTSSSSIASSTSSTVPATTPILSTSSTSSSSSSITSSNILTASTTSISTTSTSTSTTSTSSGISTSSTLSTTSTTSSGLTSTSIPSSIASSTMSNNSTIASMVTTTSNSATTSNPTLTASKTPVISSTTSITSLTPVPSSASTSSTSSAFVSPNVVSSTSSKNSTSSSTSNSSTLTATTSNSLSTSTSATSSQSVSTSNNTTVSSTSATSSTNVSNFTSTTSSMTSSSYASNSITMNNTSTYSSNTLNSIITYFSRTTVSSTSTITSTAPSSTGSTAAWLFFCDLTTHNNKQIRPMKKRDTGLGVASQVQGSVDSTVAATIASITLQQFTAYQGSFNCAHASS